MSVTTAIRTIDTLKKSKPLAKTELVFSSPLDFMVAVILSAQATDSGVNKITPALFNKFKTPYDYINCSLDDLESYVKSINFYKTKSQRIKDACKYLLDNYDGQVPDTMEKLLKIPGIARKSANVILQEIFGITEGVVVDTHVTRLSERFGWTKRKDPVKIEKDLMRLFPKNYWRDLGTQLVHHGRYICKAKNPRCEECVVNKLCPSAFKF